MMNISPLALSLLLQFAPESAVGNPPVVLYDAAVADPFPARPIPPAWRVRRAVATSPEPPPLPGRSVTERLDTLEDSVSNLLIAQSPLWHPGPRVKLVADAAPPEPPAEQGQVGKANAGMPPPDTAERGEVLDRLQAIESKVGAVLQKLEGLLRSTATAPPVGAAAPARPAAAMPPPGVVPRDRWVPFNDNAAYEVYGHEDETGCFRYTTSRPRYTAVAQPPTASYVSMPYGGYVTGASCYGTNCGQAPAGILGLVGGLFR
jgi:hypothetical protein